MRTETSHVILAAMLGVAALVALLAGLHTARAAPTATERFVTVSGSGSACTQAAPCDLPTALSQANDGNTIYIAAGTYTGTGAAVITVTRSITFYGGWDSAASGPVVCDPATYPTKLDSEWARQ